MQVSFNWLKEYVDLDIPPGELSDRITMGSIEVENVVKKGGDTIIHLAPTPNRGDCLSVIGVAREAAALTGSRLRLPRFTPPKGKGRMADKVGVVVNDKKAAPRYTARLVEGVRIGPSPEWLAGKIESCGIRSINNVVDATNLVLMELGQPVHAFDLRFLRGQKLIIDRPKGNVKLVALDGQEYTFTLDDILNLDAGRPIGAAGIMGGENSGVTDDTTTLVLESAYFDPMTIRRTSKRTGLISESSRRFEKGVDPNGVIMGLHRLTGLIVEVAGGTPSKDWVDIYPKRFKEARIDLTVSDVNRILGAGISAGVIAQLLRSIGCRVLKGPKDKFRVAVPLYRPDLTRPIDLIEEVARLYGYDRIEETMPVYRVASVVRPAGADAPEKVREALIGRGFYEAVTYGFASEEEEERFGSTPRVRLANPLTMDMVFMRTSIVPALLRSLQENLSRQIYDVKLFELNTVFRANDGKPPAEKKCLAGVMTGQPAPGCWEDGRKAVDLFDAKAAVWSVFGRLGLPPPEILPVEGRGFLHPADSFDIRYPLPTQGLRAGVRGRIGYCGQLHPALARSYDFAAPVYIFELDLDRVKEAYLARAIRYRPISRFPVVVRDVALLIDSRITHKEIMDSFNNNLNKLVQSVELFDIYSGKGIPEGKKGMAYRITFGSDEGTLSDSEVDAAFGNMVDDVKGALGAEIR